MGSALVSALPNCLLQRQTRTIALRTWNGECESLSVSNTDELVEYILEMTAPVRRTTFKTPTFLKLSDHGDEADPRPARHFPEPWDD